MIILGSIAVGFFGVYVGCQLVAARCACQRLKQALIMAQRQTELMEREYKQS